jgi:hypothetical protein
MSIDSFIIPSLSGKAEMLHYMWETALTKGEVQRRILSVTTATRQATSKWTAGPKEAEKKGKDRQVVKCMGNPWVFSAVPIPVPWVQVSLGVSFFVPLPNPYPYPWRVTHGYAEKLLCLFKIQNDLNYGISSSSSSSSLSTL